MRKQKLNGLNRTFFSILMAISINSIFVVIILSGILYMLFHNISLEYINTSNLKLLSQTSNSTNYINDMANNFGFSMFSNIDCKNLLYRKTYPQNDEDTISQTNSMTRVIEIANKTSYIHSLYLYNSNLESYYSTYLSTFNPKEQFYDKEIAELIDSTSSKNVKLLPRKLPVVNSNENTYYTNVYSYIFYDSSITGNESKDAIIINLDSKWLTNEINSLYMLNRLYAEDKSVVFVIDAVGTVINHPDKEMFLKNISEKSYIKKILSEHNESGYFIDEEGSYKSIVTYVANKDNTEWIFVSVTPYIAITQQLNKVRASIIITGLAILALGILISYFLANKVYSPILNLVKSVTNYLNPKDFNKKYTDELKFISESFDNTIEKSKTLEFFKRKNFTLLKQEMLRSLVLSPYKDLVEINKKSKEFDISLNLDINKDHPLSLVVMKIDNFSLFSKTHNERDQDIYRFAIMNITNELFSTEFTCEVINIDSEHLIILLGLSSGQNQYDGIILNISNILKEIQSIYLEHFGLSISCSISRIILNLFDITSIYKETLTNLNYKLIYGDCCIIKPSDADRYIYSEFKYPIENQIALINVIKEGKTDDIEQLFKRFVNIIRDFSYSNIILSYTCLASNIFSTLNLIEINSTIRFNLDYYSFNKEISNLETMDAINKRFLNLFENIVNSMSKFKNDKAAFLIESIKDIINSSYTDNNLSLKSIANTFKMSPTYIGKLFRETALFSISDYINEVRLKKAKELLKNSTYSIELISEKVGFENPKYFYKLFKKSYNTTPGEYRLKNCLKD